MQLSFDDFTQTLKNRLKKPLPGADAQMLMAPAKRASFNLNTLDKTAVKHAGVLALFVNKEQVPHLMLTKRVSYKGVHSGQMSFPGGRKEQTDANYEDTALRETEEETGVNTKNINTLGALTPIYIPPSNFYVEPYVGVLKQPQAFVRQVREVASIHLVPFDDILNEQNLAYEDYVSKGELLKVPYFKLDNQKVWGATAMIISELRMLFVK